MIKNQNIQMLKQFVTLFLLLFLYGRIGAAAVPQPFDLKVKADQLLKQGQVEQAIRLYQSVLEEDNRFANAYYNLATAYYLRGELEKTVENLETFLSLRPNDAEALYNLGCLKLRTGSFQEAIKCFQKAERCPCTRLVSKKIKEALLFMKDLSTQNSETQELIAYLLTGSGRSLLA